MGPLHLISSLEQHSCTPALERPRALPLPLSQPHILTYAISHSHPTLSLTHTQREPSSHTLSPTELTFTIKSLPADGDLYQLSSVYSKYGYAPKLGSKIVTVGAVVTGSDHRLIYRRRSPDAAALSAWATFSFDVHNGDTTRCVPLHTLKSCPPKLTTQLVVRYKS